jgi:HEAT repeat protein
MKRTENNFAKKGILILLALALVTTSIYANEPDELKCKNKKAAIAMLIEGIKSDNTGLVKSAVYLAGKYRVNEAVPALIQKLNSDVDDNCKVLIALSLFMIGNEDGIDAVFKLSKTDPNNHVRHMCSEIYKEFVKSVDINDPLISAVVDGKR